jgi:ABC-type nitrate/sulfonate/bicarbonate transport system substrate-binding protein
MRKAFLLIAMVCGLWSAASAGPAFAATKLSFAFVTDPTHEMYVYAIRKGIVKSDTIDLELVTLAIPALIQGFLG